MPFGVLQQRVAARTDFSEGQLERTEKINGPLSTKLKIEVLLNEGRVRSSHTRTTRSQRDLPEDHFSGHGGTANWPFSPFACRQDYFQYVSLSIPYCAGLVKSFSSLVVSDVCQRSSIALRSPRYESVAATRRIGHEDGDTGGREVEAWSRSSSFNAAITVLLQKMD